MSVRPAKSDRGLAVFKRTVTGEHMLAFLPAITLAAFWFGGEAALIAVALLAPLTFALLRLQVQADRQEINAGLLTRDGIVERLDGWMRACNAESRRTAVFVVAADDIASLRERMGEEGVERLMMAMLERLRAVLRADDLIADLGDHRLAVALSPIKRFDLEMALQLAGRMQTALEDAFANDAGHVYLSASIGFCTQKRAPKLDGEAILDAAERAVGEAALHGPSAVRAFSKDMQAVLRDRNALVDEVTTALENGQITAWYQPQINTSTGRISGFEVLARWTHPDRGLISPGVFLPAIAQAGLMERLGEVMMFQALSALREWDSAGFEVPCVGVNFSQEELANPRLSEKVKWELDRFDISPKRLCVEVLETVVTHSPDDVISRNISRLAELGCAIDLDDFGTGHASISSIRRFDVHRIKIDRSFVMHVDRDATQQKMIAAILSMAGELGIETLAEGVETTGEHAMLAQLGCDHIQGFGLARPMPLEQTGAWMQAHNDKIGPEICIGRAKG